ncbi:hypothetical protein NLJ89_g2807 [Agrocybe chaxingu]|uniref:Uncharacterized protein n=1 Tax=Agrocybe chaxingu TaxID=84603 RepID=A0A9W8MYR0_9AGAR|nr:hypothetical protein NLJ89_g2807 [Agrocybe chaxingu]
MSSNLVAFILGAGSHIGAALAAHLRKNGYRVALGSRNPKPDTSEDEGYFHVKVDVESRVSIESAFEAVVSKLGPVNAVIYNGELPPDSSASVAFPEDEADFLSLSSEEVYKAALLGAGTFAAAQQALKSFRNDVHREHPKAFIVTGNLLPFDQFSPSKFFTLGAQKALQTRFVATASKSYEAENIKFYFATLVGKDGGLPGPDFPASAETHAKVYWELINNKQTNWDHRFTLDGKTFLPSV